MVTDAIIRDIRFDPSDLAGLERIARLGVCQDRGGIPHGEHPVLLIVNMFAPDR
jgi:hypothetical protein